MWCFEVVLERYSCLPFLGIKGGVFVEGLWFVWMLDELRIVRWSGSRCSFEIVRFYVIMYVDDWSLV